MSMNVTAARARTGVHALMASTASHANARTDIQESTARDVSCIHIDNLKVHHARKYNPTKDIILALKVILLDRLQGNICSVI